MSESLAVGRASTRPARAAGRRRRARSTRAASCSWPWAPSGCSTASCSSSRPCSPRLPRMLAGSAHGNPAFVAGPITWSATLIDHHVVVLNAIFATIQLALGLGIAWRPTVRLALAASVAWSLAVWWLGEGLGGILAGTASPSTAPPGRSSCTRCSPSCCGPPTAPRRALSGRPRRRPPPGPGRLARPLGQPGRLRPAARVPRPRRHQRLITDGPRAPRLARLDRHPRRQRPEPPRPGRLDRARGPARPGGRRRLPARARRPRRHRPGPRR